MQQIFTLDSKNYRPLCVNRSLLDNEGFMDLKQAFDSVHFDGMRQALVVLAYLIDAT